MLKHEVALCKPHFVYLLQASNDSDDQLEFKTSKSKRRGKDAFYGNAKTSTERAVKDWAHQARVAIKSGDGFLTNLRISEGRSS